MHASQIIVCKKYDYQNINLIFKNKKKNSE